MASLLMGIMNTFLIVCEGHAILLFCYFVMRVLLGDSEKVVPTNMDII